MKIYYFFVPCFSLIKLKKYDCIILFQNFNVLIGLFILYYYMAIILEDIVALKIQEWLLDFYLHWGFLVYLNAIIYSSNFYYDLFFSHITWRLFVNLKNLNNYLNGYTMINFLPWRLYSAVKVDSDVNVWSMHTRQKRRQKRHHVAPLTAACPI